MRFYAIAIGLLIATCCLFFPQQVKAQTPNTYTYSTIDFDDSTGTILATGHTQADYQTGAYYQRTGAQSKIVDSNGNQLALNRNEVYGVTADVSTQTDAYANQEYTVLTGHWLLATYYVYNYYNYHDGQYETGYYDPYNYSYYEGQNIIADEPYDFYGWGPITVKYTADKILGQTRKTYKVGMPHHLYVSADRTISEDCGRVHRFIDFLVVDINNHGVGRLSIMEAPQNITDSCTGETVTLSSCSNASVSSYGVFTDSLKTGCPRDGSIPPDSCGFAAEDEWEWCDNNDIFVPSHLAWLFYAIHHSYIQVNGEASSVGEYEY